MLPRSMLVHIAHAGAHLSIPLCVHFSSCFNPATTTEMLAENFVFCLLHEYAVATDAALAAIFPE